MKTRLWYQPARNDFIIFWGLELCGVALAIVLQMEIGNYQSFVPLAWLVLAAVIAIGIAQIWRTRLTITASTLNFGRILASNAITVSWADVRGMTQHGHTFTIDTRGYGRLTIMCLVQAKQLRQVLATHGLVIDQKG